MPVWLIEYFGREDLNQAFLWIALMTAPVWIGMIVFPTRRLVRSLAHPLILPPLYAVVMLFLVWKFYEASLLPDPIDNVSYTAAQSFARQPTAFLALFCNLQILNLVLGTLMYQKANRSGFRIPFELLLCWWIGAPAVLLFAGRLLLQRKALR